MIANLAVLLLGATFAAPTPCANLKSISLPNTTITMAESVSPGVFTPPAAAPANPAPTPAPAAPAGGGRGGQRGAAAPPAAALNVPAFCRVAATLRPSSDSQIDME